MVHSAQLEKYKQSLYLWFVIILHLFYFLYLFWIRAYNIIFLFILWVEKLSHICEDGKHTKRLFWGINGYQKKKQDKIFNKSMHVFFWTAKFYKLRKSKVIEYQIRFLKLEFSFHSLIFLVLFRLNKFTNFGYDRNAHIKVIIFLNVKVSERHWYMKFISKSVTWKVVTKEMPLSI